MALGELIRTVLGTDSNPGVTLYEWGECNSTFERTELQNELICPACGAVRIARANTVDSHT